MNYSSPLLPRDTLQRPLHDLRLSVIETCNYRCPYCMPEGRDYEDEKLSSARRLTADQIESLVRAFVALGVRKVRLTGGEPLLRKDLAEIIARLSKIEAIEDLALTTNGSLLEKHARVLRDAGLQRLTVSMDALDAEVFSRMSGGRGDVQQVLAGIAAAERAGFQSLKINCVVQRGMNEDQVLPLADYFRGTPHVLRFIEYMDVGNCNQWQAADVLSSQAVHSVIHARWPLQPMHRHYIGEVAERYAYQDGQGEIGFVSSISSPFCGDCHRVRVSADGQMFTCLFASSGIDLSAALSEGEHALQRRIAERWQQRADRYSEERAGLSKPRKKIEMFFIGG